MYKTLWKPQRSMWKSQRSTYVETVEDVVKSWEHQQSCSQAQKYQFPTQVTKSPYMTWYSSSKLSWSRNPRFLNNEIVSFEILGSYPNFNEIVSFEIIGSYPNFVVKSDKLRRKGHPLCERVQSKKTNCLFCILKK